MVAGENRKLLPVIGWLLRRKCRGDWDAFAQDICGRPDATPREAYDGLRRWLLRGDSRLGRLSSDGEYGFPGVMRGAWRVLLSLSSRDIRELFRGIRPDMPDSLAPLAILDAISASGVKRIPSPLVRTMLTGAKLAGFSFEFSAINRIFVSSACERYGQLLRSGQATSVLCLEEAPVVHDWLCQELCVAGSSIGNKGTWSAMLAEAMAWKSDYFAYRELEMTRNRRLAWAPGLDPQVIEGCDVRPLATANDLENEGKAMEHCVGNYARRCFDGRALVFSLSSTAGRSTLELRRKDGVWSIAQLLSRANTGPPVEHWPVAVKIAAILESMRTNAEPRRSPQFECAFCQRGIPVAC